MASEQAAQARALGAASEPAAAKDPAAPELVRLEGVTRRFGAVAAVEDVSLSIRRGEFFALLGPSGCGKTTLLRLLAGFERPDSGRILLEGSDLAPVPPYRRPLNMMFQSYALFPHLTVRGNVAFGLRQERLPAAEIDARVEEMLALVRLTGFGARKPHQLSGGQRQRVALARALAKRPRMLLLDEPLAALDRKLREETRFELMALQARLGLTFVIVTHDREEAMTVASRIAVMDCGRLVQVGSPAEIYERPHSRFVADFIGDVNLLEGRFAGMSGTAAIVETEFAGRLFAEAAAAVPGATVWLALRPEKVRLTRERPADGTPNTVAGLIVELGYLGDVTTCKIALDGGETMKAAVANTTRASDRLLARGNRVWLSWAADAAALLTQ